MTYHEGELEVQTRAGVRASAARIARGVRSEMPPIARDFLSQQRFAVAGSVDADGRVWASLLTGAPGFLDAVDEGTLRIDVLPAHGDPLAENVKQNPALGLIVIDFATRVRVRLNGSAQINDGELRLLIEQAYSNCPKYIQARVPEAYTSETPQARHMGALTDGQQDWITAADTFFIATYTAEGGADASHRGGKPGFVRVVGADRLEFPDYKGNTMFNTLGNLAANPHGGLLLLDFERGNVLQVSGQAEVNWDMEKAETFAGAERVVTFHVERVIEIVNGLPLRYRFVEASGFNP